MRTLLGMLMLVIVSGDDKTTDCKGILGDSVLLPCVCSDRDLNEEFLWQKEKPIKMPVYKHSGNTSNYSDTYKGRAITFLSENSDNCSVLLINITEKDLGIYLCSFFQDDEYKKVFVNLSSYEWIKPTNINSATQAPYQGHSPKAPHKAAHSRHRILNSIPTILVVVLVLCLLLRCSSQRVYGA